MITLTLKNVVYDYVSKAGITHALKGVSAEFISGKLYAITGRSGSGKTTLLSLLAAFDRPKSGDILLNGVSILTYNSVDYRRENIGMIFQSYNLIGHLTALENVMLASEICKTKRKKSEQKQLAMHVLRQVGLWVEHIKKRPLTLSGGEQQRVAIPRAIASDSPIILADEPTGNLDNENSENILNLLKCLAHENNKCVILVTHSEEIAQQADIRIHMSDGIVQSEM